MSHDGSWRRSTWTPPKRFKSSVISKQARRWESTGAPFNSPTRPVRFPDWHWQRLSWRQLARLIVFLPLNPDGVTTLGDCETYSALLLKCTYFAHRCAFVPISRHCASLPEVIPNEICMNPAPFVRTHLAWFAKRRERSITVIALSPPVPFHLGKVEE